MKTPRIHGRQALLLVEWFSCPRATSHSWRVNFCERMAMSACHLWFRAAAYRDVLFALQSSIAKRHAFNFMIFERRINSVRRNAEQLRYAHQMTIAVVEKKKNNLLRLIFYEEIFRSYFFRNNVRIS